jgi:hypothetical protein
VVSLSAISINVNKGSINTALYMNVHAVVVVGKTQQYDIYLTCACPEIAYHIATSNKSVFNSGICI